MIIVNAPEIRNNSPIRPDVVLFEDDLGKAVVAALEPELVLKIEPVAEPDELVAAAKVNRTLCQGGRYRHNFAKNHPCWVN